MADESEFQLNRDQLNEIVAGAVNQALEQRDAATAADRASQAENMNRIMLTLQSRAPGPQTAAQLEAGPALPRNRGTLVTVQTPAAAAAAAGAAAYASFNYRAFLDRAKPFARDLDNLCRQFGYQQLDAFVQIAHESGWDPLVHSTTGAIGLTRIPEDRANAWHVRADDPLDSMRALIVHMKQYREGFTTDLKQGKYNPPADPVALSFAALDLALAAWDAGGVDAIVNAGGIPPSVETLHYVSMVGQTIRAIHSNAPTRAVWIDDWKSLLRG